MTGCRRVVVDVCRGQVVGRSRNGVTNQNCVGNVEFVVGEGGDVASGGVEPSAGSGAACGVVDGHGSGIQGVVAVDGVFFLRTSEVSCFCWCGDLRVGCDFSDIIPQRRVDIEGGGVELSSGVG